VTPFKRTESNFEGGEALINGRMRDLPRQPVRIIRKAVAGNDDEEDRYEVEFFNVGVGIVDECDLHPSPSFPATNEELLAHMCRNGSTAMVQAFIMTAVQNTAQEVVDNEAEVRANMAGSMIHPDLWINTAKEILETVKDRS
jgi:hypothetical protein